MKNKSSTEDKKRQRAEERLLGFLRALYQVSVSPGVYPFCTPGHKTGRGFAMIMAAGPEGSRLEEVG